MRQYPNLLRVLKKILKPIPNPFIKIESRLIRDEASTRKNLPHCHPQAHFHFFFFIFFLLKINPIVSTLFFLPHLVASNLVSFFNLNFFSTMEARTTIKPPLFFILFLQLSNLSTSILLGFIHLFIYYYYYYSISKTIINFLLYFFYFRSINLNIRNFLIFTNNSKAFKTN